ncbi:MAG TPA: 5-formyltetrahydrofolate cyclo-ligase [Tissierellaceae bacterium]|nr:5-formyltetrahydrofolate cyclo-ligase [Tissierellaceae bacterium]
MKKNIIRKEILEERGKLDDKRHKQSSKKIIDSVLKSPYYKKSKILMVFVSTPDEIDTHRFIEQAIEDGKIVTVPITIPETKELKPSQITSLDELELGFYNILSPKEEFIRHIDPKEIDLVIVPGLGFDSSGYRVGYGGGYYDRFLSKLPNVIKLSIAFDFQILEKVPKDDFDIPVDYIFTEKRIVDCK